VTESLPKIQNSPLYNEDLAPVPAGGRTWGTWNIAALWVGMAVCIPTYTYAWFVSLLIAGLVHIVLSIAFPAPATKIAGGENQGEGS